MKDLNIRITIYYDIKVLIKCNRIKTRTQLLGPLITNI